MMLCFSSGCQRVHPHRGSLCNSWPGGQVHASKFCGGGAKATLHRVLEHIHINGKVIYLSWRLPAKRASLKIFPNGGVQYCGIERKMRGGGTKAEPMGLPDSSQTEAGIIFSACLLYLRFMAESQSGNDKSELSRFSLALPLFLVVTHGRYCPQTRPLSPFFAYHTKPPLPSSPSTPNLP
jgi:hypothetical protein